MLVFLPIPAAVFALAVLAYANSLTNGFVWDDPIVLSRQLVAFDSVSKVLVTPRGIPQFAPDYYRPVVIASYLLDRAVGGGAPFAFHLSVVLMHAATSALVALLGLVLFGRDRPACFGALAAGALFAVHPVHSESVAWSAGRSDVLATGFLAAALCSHARASRSWRTAAMTGLLVFLALASKETAVVVLPLLIGLDLLPRAGGRGKAGPPLRWMRFAPVAAAAGVYLVLRRASLGSLAGDSGAPPVARSAADLLGAFAHYIGKLVWPARLNAYIDTIPVDPASLILGGAGLLTAAAAGAWWVRAGQWLPLFFLSWTLLALLPSLTILWKIPEAPLAERYLYLPSAGFCLLLGWLAARAAEQPSRAVRVAAPACTALLVLAGLAGTVRRNPVWRDNFALWSDTASKSTTSGMPLRSLGTALLQEGRREEARRAFEQALARSNSPSGLTVIRNNLGTIAMQEGDFAAAERHYREAAALDANAPDTLFNLGLAIVQRGRQSADAARAALPFYEKAERLSPYDPDIQAALGQVFLVTGDGERARRHMRRALELGLAGASAESVRRHLEAEQ